jgi:AAA+ ATPase superfamily predicted ATPase
VPFTFREAGLLLNFTDPIDTLTAYGILGGIPLYLSYFRADRTIRENLLTAIASPTARLYVEPQAVFAAHHDAYNQAQALGILRAIANGQQSWSEIADAIDLRGGQFGRMMDRLIDDLGLVRRVLPVTERRESRTYRTQYHLTDNFFRFWFRFIEPNQGPIEFGNGEAVVEAIMAQLSEYMGLPFEALCREWVQLASATGTLRTMIGAVGTWWDAKHQIDVVGLNPQREVAILGECKWRNQGFTWRDLQTYLDHVRALGQVASIRPDAQHILFSKTGFDAQVQEWASSVGARLLTPHDLLAPFSEATSPTA